MARQGSAPIHCPSPLFQKPWPSLLKKVTKLSDAQEVSGSSQGKVPDSITFSLTEVKKSVKKSSQEKVQNQRIDPETIKRIVSDGKRFGNGPKPKTQLHTHLSLLLEENSFVEGQRQLESEDEESVASANQEEREMP